MNAQSGRVLVVDDDPTVRLLVERLLRREGFDVEVVATAADGLLAARRGFRGVVVLNLGLPDRTAPQLLSELVAVAPQLPVVLLGREGQAAPDDTLLSGTVEFVDASRVTSGLVGTVARAMEGLQASGTGRASLDELPAAFRGIVTGHATMRAVLHSLRGTLESRVPVLIHGESGTGRELVARALHSGGPRAHGPFVVVNCAGIPDDLLEAELFGHERGALPGTASARPGRFDLAQRGTLLLDEIGEMPVRSQARLVRVLREGEYQRVGGAVPLKADVRILSSTRRHLEREVEAGRFSEDLYRMLSVNTVDLPPLREREGDIPLLVEHFVGRAAAREAKTVRGVEPAALELLEAFSYPGNVRQLEQVVAHAVITARGPVLSVVDFPPSFLSAVAMERRSAGADARQDHAPPPPRPRWGPENFPSLADLERQHIEAALEVAEGNKALAARMLGISRMTLYRKIREHDLDIEISTIDESG